MSSPASSSHAAPVLFKVADLHAGYGRSKVLHGIALSVGSGETVGLLGRNGAGRSTFLKAVMRLIDARGEVQMRGIELGRSRTHEVTRAGIGYVPEDKGIFPDLTVRENLSVGTPAKRSAKPQGPAWSEDEFFEMFPNLKNRAGVAAGLLSGGEQQMLTICRTLMGSPSLLLIDEPTEGLSLSMVQQVAQLLSMAASRGVAILLVEQKLTIALELCQRVAVMGRGRIVFDGSVQAFRDTPSVREEWLEV
ncbi:MAG: transporter ATP-binding protein [Rhizobacter sp.]|nr:transporter ATP-binding protein [Rhizobacter sp.]